MRGNKTMTMAKIYCCGEYRVVRDIRHPNEMYALYRKATNHETHKLERKLIGRYRLLSQAIDAVVEGVRFVGL